MANLHQRVFTQPRPWSQGEFTQLLAEPSSVSVTKSYGFAIARLVLDEAELLTIAVDPLQQRNGLGTELLSNLVQRVSKLGATSLFLEVAQNNQAALALYQRAGFAQVGMRKAYYGQTLDAHIYRKLLTPPESR
jgi:[ribosomal protein S18]-alanine N-acetyltransferase